MRHNIVKLHFTSPLHLSKGKTALDSSFQILHSDTLKSALFANALMLYPKELSASEGLAAERFFHAFTVSSAFPYCGAEYFFPKPALLPSGFVLLDKTGQADHKAIKRLKYVGLSWFQQLLEGIGVSFTEDKLFQAGAFLSDLLISGSDSDIIHSDVVQRVVVPRVDGPDANTFYMERLFFREDGGLFCLIDTDESTFEGVGKMVAAAFELLGDNGVGSDRTVGNGQFTPSEGILDLPDVTAPTHQITLGLFCPSEKEFTAGLLEGSPAYGLTKRGGYIATPQDAAHAVLRKKAVYMFTEGSLFSGKKPEGKVVDLRPDIMKSSDHPVWRDGRPIALPFRFT